MNHECEWIRWWCWAWLEADESWWPKVLTSLSLPQLQQLARGYHQSLGTLFGLTAISPIEPSEALIEFALADAHRQRRILALAAAICEPCSEQGLDEYDSRWCERVARGLRPGQWLEGDNEPLRLLQYWAGDTGAWQRIRLRFSRQRIERVEAGSPITVPHKKLDIFWQSIIWRCQSAVT